MIRTIETIRRITMIRLIERALGHALLAIPFTGVSILMMREFRWGEVLITWFVVWSCLVLIHLSAWLIVD
jgi:hypothetical protein